MAVISCVSEKRIGAGKDITSDVSWVLTADPSPSASSFERALSEESRRFLSTEERRGLSFKSTSSYRLRCSASLMCAATGYRLSSMLYRILCSITLSMSKLPEVEIEKYDLRMLRIPVSYTDELSA
jgi:hypothetical protein